MIKKSNFKTRSVVRLKFIFKDVKNYSEKIYEKYDNIIIVFGIIMYLFATIFSIVSNSIILAVFLSVFLPIIISVMIGMLDKGYPTIGVVE